MNAKYVLKDFTEAIILPILKYSLPCFINFLSPQSKTEINRILKRLSYLIGKNKDDFIENLYTGNEKITEKFIASILNNEDNPLRHFFYRE